MYHIVYKTTNTINGKIYIGYHKCKKLKDSYLGSGTILNRAIKFYGKEYFIRETLFVFDNKVDAMKKELEIVNEDFVARDDTYNVTLGGLGGSINFIKDHVYVKDTNGTVLRVHKTDTRYVSGEFTLVGSKKGLTRVIRNGISKDISIELLEYMKIHGWQPWSKGMMRYKDSNGNDYYLNNKDPKILELQLSPWTKGMKVMKNSKGDTIWIAKNQVTEDLSSIVKDTITVKDSVGNFLRVHKTDSRYLSGELVGVNRGKSGLSAHLNNKDHICPHCRIKTTLGNIKRWHGDKCKNITESNE